MQARIVSVATMKTKKLTPKPSNSNQSQTAAVFGTLVLACALVAAN